MAKTQPKRKSDELSTEGLAVAIGEGWQVMLDPEASPEQAHDYINMIEARYRNNVAHADTVPKSVMMFDMAFLLKSYQETRDTLASLRRKG